MKSRIYAMLDTVALSYVGGLSLFGHDAAAVRAFGDALSDRQNPMSRHPKDFDLHLMGEFDDQSGSIVGHMVLTDLAVKHEPPICVITGAAWLAAQDAERPQLPLDDRLPTTRVMP